MIWKCRCKKLIVGEILEIDCKSQNSKNQLKMSKFWKRNARSQNFEKKEIPKI